VCVCEPQSVITDFTCTGSRGSETSKMRMPSQPTGELDVLAQLELDWRASTDWNSSSRPPKPYTPMSDCAPRQRKSESTFGFRALPMSRIRKPL
jgi:hypothetical protein